MRDFEAELRQAWARDDVQRQQSVREAAPARVDADEATTPSLRLVDLNEDDRPRERLLRVGAEALSNKELLAVLLSTGQRDEDVLQVAERLLSDRGLVGLLRSDVHELMQQSGVGEAKATRIKAAVEFARRGLADDEWPAREPYQSAEQVYRRYRALIGDLTHEEVWVLVLDQQNCLIREEQIYRGTIHGASVRVAEVLRPVIVHHGAAMIVVHNHPSGLSTPSTADRSVTSDLCEAAQTMDIQVLDHVIVGRSEYSSMSRLGLLSHGGSGRAQNLSEASARYRA